jgi:hypothetical protein
MVGGFIINQISPRFDLILKKHLNCCIFSENQHVLHILNRKNYSTNGTTKPRNGNSRVNTVGK